MVSATQGSAACSPTDGDLAVSIPRRVGRNHPCPCGSGSKYKKCCLLRRPRRRASSPGEEDAEAGPGWIAGSRRKLYQFVKYACHVYRLPRLLQGISDRRRKPKIPTMDVVNSLFHTAVLRIPSLNALEGDLKESDFQKLIGRKPRPNRKVFSAEVVANVLDKLNLEDARQALEDLFWRAERNRAFREGSYGALRCVAIDGWEPFCSFHRHCPYCLVRKIKVKRRSGEIEEVDQYYHRYVVALLVGPLIDVVLGIEPVRNPRARREAGEQGIGGAEGELPAARRLLDSLHKTYGTFLDAFIFDSLYPNGPLLTQLEKLRYGAFIVLKKNDNEPLKEALALWEGQNPCRRIEDPEAREQIEFWDVDELETLDTYNGKIRVVRAVVTTTQPRPVTKTWCIAVVGQRARRASLTSALKITRARWHVENTAFHQWVSYWNLSHVFHHTANALMAVLLLWSIAFNLLQLFVFRRLRRPRRPKDPTDTIRHIVEVMSRDVATLSKPIPWAKLTALG